MNTIIERSATSQILQEAYHGARSGAANGAIAGMSFVSSVLATGGCMSGLEIGSRAVGSAPRWAFFEGDCKLAQFRDTDMCTQPPVFNSVTSLSVYFVGVTIIGGMFLGAISGAARGVFTKSPKE